MKDSAVRYSVLTPVGRGAVAVVRVLGNGHIECVDGCFEASSGRSLAEQPIGTIRYGRWCATGEDVVVLREKDAVEIHCHGGVAAVGSIATALEESGAEQSDADRSTTPVVESKVACQIEYEATRQLTAATTERTASLLLDQAHGALRNDLLAIRQLLLAKEAKPARSALQRLLNTALLGQHLVEPWQVVIAGPANVGKSSLLNAMLGYERAVVFDMPGTTRDVVTAHAAVEGWPISFRDTAGIREPSDPLEAAGIELGRRTLTSADLLLLVAEANAAFYVPDEVVPAMQAWYDLAPPATPAIVVLSKCDLIDLAKLQMVLQEIEQRVPWPVVATASTEAWSIANLLDQVATELVPILPPTGGGIVFTPIQCDVISQAVQAIVNDDTAKAVELIDTLLA